MDIITETPENAFDYMVSLINEADSFKTINKILHQLIDAKNGVEYNF